MIWPKTQTSLQITGAWEVIMAAPIPVHSTVEGNAYFSQSMNPIGLPASAACRLTMTPATLPNMVRLPASETVQASSIQQWSARGWWSRSSRSRGLAVTDGHRTEWITSEGKKVSARLQHGCEGNRQNQEKITRLQKKT